MPVSFERIPANWRVPLYWVELDPSKAGLPLVRNAALLVGTKTASGKATADIPKPIGNQAYADDQFGQGSELANMFRAFFANNFSQEVWGLPLAEPPAGTAATNASAITISNAPTSAGTYDLYICGVNVPVGCAGTETPTSMATAVAAAINANDDLPVTAVGGAGTVAITCKWKGTSGNSVDIRDNYFGPGGGEQMPGGMVVTYANNGKLTSGAGQPTLTSAIANMGETEFDYVALPWTDTTSLTAFETEYGFSDTGRWGFIRQHFGQIFSAKADSYSNLIAFGATRNCPQLSVLGIEVDSPTPIWQWAAAYCSKAARALANDPARPLQTLLLESCLPAQAQNRFKMSELNTLASNGIATQRTPTPNAPMISRETTTYTLNRYGFSDDAYELVTTMATLAKILRNQRQAITSKYPRHKLADDGTRYGAGQAIVTPKTIKAELVAQYRMDEFNGLVENGSAFKSNLIVERDPNDPNRVNILYPPDLVNQLRIFAVLAQFRLQYNRGVDLALA